MLKEKVLNGAIILSVVLLIIGYSVHYIRWQRWNRFVKEEAVVDSTMKIYQKEILIDVNRATKEELQRIPGIGPKTAENIISCRDTLKGFLKVEDLLYVKGIGKKRLEKIRRYIYVR